jgi:hypothetical protein
LPGALRRAALADAAISGLRFSGLKVENELILLIFLSFDLFKNHPSKSSNPTLFAAAPLRLEAADKVIQNVNTKTVSGSVQPPLWPRR